MAGLHDGDVGFWQDDRSPAGAVRFSFFLFLLLLLLRVLVVLVR
jgi:hypothetical protein